jgi:hypothetical protein
MAMFFVFQVMVKDEFTGAELIRDTSLRGKNVEPHDNKVEEMDQHLLWE